jgi:hypothetical protein
MSSYNQSTGSKLQSDASDVCSDDTSHLKMAVTEWINSCDNLVEQLLSHGKEEHGIGHNITSQLLCPIDYDWDDPE